MHAISKGEHPKGSSVHKLNGDIVLDQLELYGAFEAVKTWSAEVNIET